MNRATPPSIPSPRRIAPAILAAVILLALLPFMTRGADAASGITVVIEDSSPSEIYEPGRKAAFGIEVTNDSSEPLTITAATGSLNGSPAHDISGGQPGDVVSTTCDDDNALGNIIGAVLAPGGKYSCSFIIFVGGDAGDVLTEVVTVTAENSAGASTSDQDQRSYTIRDALPTIDVTKSADLTSVAAPGADVTFTASVKNTSPEPVTITAATESIDGGPQYNLGATGGPILETTCDDAVGTVLAADATYSCTFLVFVGGSAGTNVTDTVTFTVKEDEGNTTNDTAQKTFAIKSGPAPEVWGVTEAGSVYEFTGVRWTRRSGRLAQLDVGNGEVWGVTEAGSVYRWTAGRWTRMPGRLKQVSVGTRADGSLLVMGVTEAGSVYRFDSGRWIKLSGRLDQLDVGNKGEVWGTTAANSVYQYLGSNKWSRKPGTMMHVSVGSNADGSTLVWALGSTGSAFRWQAGTWVDVPGRLANIDVGTGPVWGVTAAGSVYRYAGNYRWINVGGRLLQVSVGT